jgi:hypothetical protein
MVWVVWFSWRAYFKRQRKVFAFEAGCYHGQVGATASAYQQLQGHFNALTVGNGGGLKHLVQVALAAAHLYRHKGAAVHKGDHLVFVKDAREASLQASHINLVQCHKLQVGFEQQVLLQVAPGRNAGVARPVAGCRWFAAGALPAGCRSFAGA